LPKSVRGALLPLVVQIGELTASVRKYDAEVRRELPSLVPGTHAANGGKSTTTEVTDAILTSLVM
jgi:hypothetical protein